MTTTACPQPTDPDHERSGYSPNTLHFLADTLGTATAQAPTARFTAEELAPIRARILEVAAQVLDEDELAAVKLYVGGKSQKEIAAELSWPKSKVSRVLHGGTPGAASGRRGALKTLAAALEADAEVRVLSAMVAAIEREDRPTNTTNATAAPAIGQLVSEWYLPSIRPVQIPGLFGPLAVLLVASRLADAKGTVSLEDLRRCVPSASVSSSIPTLQARGYARLDSLGTRLVILKTPTDENAQHAAKMGSDA